MTSQMRIGVLETGRPPEELLHHGDYPQMVARWLNIPEARFTAYPALEGRLPDSPQEADLWVITGSRFGVYEEHPWISPLESFIRECKSTGSRMIGICFGHQLIAQALGGRVEKSSKGWGLGIHEYTPSGWPEALAPAPHSLRLQAFHQDQVTALPEGAHRIARSEFCENAALWYPGFALTVQGHPEFGKAYVRDLLKSRRGNALPEQPTDIGLKTLAQPTTRHDLAELIRLHVNDI